MAFGDFEKVLGSESHLSGRIETIFRAFKGEDRTVRIQELITDYPDKEAFILDKSADMKIKYGDTSKKPDTPEFQSYN